jgi:2-iminobutanoate/2-iminopropanoate deaminase
VIERGHQRLTDVGRTDPICHAFRIVADSPDPGFPKRRLIWRVIRLREIPHTSHDLGIASQIGKYSDAVAVEPNLRWLVISGTPGLSTTGDRPGDIAGQARLAWEHIVRMPERAGMTTADVVKVTQYLTRPEDIPADAEVRTRFLGEARPASMLLVIPQLVRPDFVVEVEIIAARA